MDDRDEGCTEIPDGDERQGESVAMAPLAQEIQATLEAYKSGLAPQIGMVSPDIAKDWNLGSGFQPYNLQPVALLLYPQLSPIRNMTARVQGRGKQVEFKAITAINNTNLNGWVAEGTAASTVQSTFSDVVSVYRSMALADKVTYEQQWGSAGFVDSKSVAVTNLLRAMMIQEENNILFGQNTAAAANQQAPGAAGNAPQPGVSAGGSGGSIAAATYYVKQTVITGIGESLSSSTPVSQAVSSGQQLTLTPVLPAGQPVFGVNFYVSTSSGGTYYLVTAANLAGAQPSSATLNGLSWLTNGQAIVLNTVPSSGTTAPGADSSANANAYNGLIAQMFGGAGASLTALNGTLTVSAIDALFLKLWNAGRADPDGVWCNAQESVKITNLTLGAGAPYYVVVNEQNQATGNYRVARLTNKVTGSEVPVKVHPTLPQGFMLFLSSKLPGWYVPTDVPSVWALDLPNALQDTARPPVPGG